MLNDANDHWVRELLRELKGKLSPKAIAEKTLRKWLKMMVKTGPHASFAKLMVTIEACNGKAIPAKTRSVLNALEPYFAFDGHQPTRFGAYLGPGELPFQQRIKKTSHRPRQAVAHATPPPDAVPEAASATVAATATPPTLPQIETPAPAAEPPLTAGISITHNTIRPLL